MCHFSTEIWTRFQKLTLPISMAMFSQERMNQNNRIDPIHFGLINKIKRIEHIDRMSGCNALARNEIEIVLSAKSAATESCKFNSI